ncbi:hypothetical protein SAMN06298210_1331, partial [Prevotellaceae bacterium KH2P17]
MKQYNEIEKLELSRSTNFAPSCSRSARRMK